MHTDAGIIYGIFLQRVDNEKRFFTAAKRPVAKMIGLTSAVGGTLLRGREKATNE